MSQLITNSFPKRGSLRSSAVVATVLVASSAFAESRAELDPKALQAAAKAQAEGTTVRIGEGEQGVLVERLSKPILTYVDNARSIHDARLWLYQTGARPVALLKTEFITIKAKPEWMYCAASLTEAPVGMTLANGRRWTSTKPGIEWQTLAFDIPPADSSTGRLRQLKELARRFTATSRDVQNGLQEMRLLNQPMHRYAIPDEHVVDGALFGLTNNGANPDLLLLLEARRLDSVPFEWRFSAAQMTTAELLLRFNDREVWRGPAVTFARGLQDQQRWMFFSEIP